MFFYTYMYANNVGYGSSCPCNNQVKYKNLAKIDVPDCVKYRASIVIRGHLYNNSCIYASRYLYKR